MAHSSEVLHLLSLLEYGHLPPHLQNVSKPFSEMGHRMADLLNDGYELKVGIRKLIEAKDCMVRQAVIDKRNRDEGVVKGI